MERSLFLETGEAHICKFGEIFCGDSLSVAPTAAGGKLMVLSNGPGSGIRAHILATLVTRIGLQLMEEGLTPWDAASRLTEILLSSDIQQIQTSGFTLLKAFEDGSMHLVERDNPPTFFFKQGCCRPLHYKENGVETGKLREAHVCADAGDWLVMMTEGGIHTGIDGLPHEGWDWEKVAEFLENRLREDASAQEVAQVLIDRVCRLYQEKLGDDTAVGVLKVRSKRFAAFMIGPPAKSDDDDAIVDRFLKMPGRKIVCGGTTSSIVAEKLGKDVETDISSMTAKIPPIGKLEGLELVTEGARTVNHALEILREISDADQLTGERDGACRLVWEFLRADSIHIFLGLAANPAHLDPDLSDSIRFKNRSVQTIADILKEKGKDVRLEIQ